VDRYRLAVFVLSAVVTGLGGALQGFLNYLVSADSYRSRSPASCSPWW